MRPDGRASVCMHQPPRQSCRALARADAERPPRCKAAAAWSLGLQPQEDWRYRKATMASTLTSLLYHVVFSTKERRQLIGGGLRCPLYEYIGGVIRKHGGGVVAIGGAADHVHILAAFAPVVSVSDMLRHIKGSSSRWVNESGRQCAKFAWQRGYAAFSVSESMAPAVSKYIEQQEKHHGRLMFQDEFVALLRKHNVQYDERYIWG